MIFDNPEFTRLRRSKLRPGKMLVLGGIAAVICGGILCLQYVAETQFGRIPVPDVTEMLHTFFFWCVGIELAIVSIYGSVLAAQNIVLERERSTLDFQRLIGMGPWRLSVGKLFGAPLEAFWIAIVFMLFSGLGVMGGGVSMSFFVQSQVVIIVYGLMMSALGLLCSAIVDKTSSASGMAMLFSLVMSIVYSTFAAKASVGLVSASSPIYYFMAIYQNSNAHNLYSAWRAQPMYVNIFGYPTHILIPFCFINVFVGALAFLSCVRRVANDEFSFMNLRHAIFAFLVTQVILISEYASVVSRNDGLAVFHCINLFLLLGLSFGLTPSGELVRGRLHRAKSGDHWRLMFERTNRLQDAPAMGCVLLFTLIYVVEATVLTFTGSNAQIQDVAAIAMVAGASIGMAATLLYIHVYLDKGSFRLGLVLLFVALAIPPGIMSLAVSGQHCVLVSPLAYLASLGTLATMRLNDGPDALGAIWSCPLICIAIGALSFILAAMRIRYLLDTNESQRLRDAEAIVKADASVPAETAAARVLAKQ